MSEPRVNSDLRAKDTKGTIKRLLKYIAKEKGLLIGMIFFVLLASVATVGASAFVKPLIDNLLTSIYNTKKFSIEIFEPIKKYLIMLFFVFIIAIITSYARERCIVFLTQKTLRRLRKDLFDSVSDLPISFYDSVPNGEIMSRFTNDVESLRMFLSQGLSQLVSSVITVTGSFIFMIYLGGWLTLIVIAMLFLMIFLVKTLGKKSAFFFKKQQKQIGVVNGYVEETISGQKVVKIFNHENEIIEGFAVVNEDLRKASTGANTFASILFPILGNLTHLNYAVCASVGAIIVINGSLTPGSLVAFLTYARSFSQPIADLSQQFNNAIMAIAGAERIFEYLDEKPEQDEGYINLVNAKIDENGNIVECD
ncbi:MAG: ABC transporter ATP-binding protein, partial [Clostridiales bacterium]|nr:ABC transporter ATP-binding protein [Clostridiales bacterium]